jgi:AhpD family alkylhydroperoxidase
LIAIAIGVAVRCDDCIAFHVKAAVDQGASKDEIMKPLAWRSIWMQARLQCMQAMLSTPTRNSPLPNLARLLNKGVTDVIF